MDILQISVIAIVGIVTATDSKLHRTINGNGHQDVAVSVLSIMEHTRGDGDSFW